MYNRYSDKGELVKIIDSTLNYEGFLGEGVNAGVLKVSKGKHLYALKIKFKENPSLREEFSKQKALNGIYGVPDAINLYGPDAFLMDLVDGRPLCFVHGVRDEFFEKLKDVARQINERGYTVQRDFQNTNVMVGSNGDPWVVDFNESEFQGLPAPKWVFDNARMAVNNLRIRYERYDR